jgi:hypothetical protein
MDVPELFDRLVKASTTANSFSLNIQHVTCRRCNYVGSEFSLLHDRLGIKLIEKR